MLVCKHVHYSGRVQGVGFRYTAVDAAQGFPVGGFVRNLSDGRVEVVVEGNAGDVNAFLKELAERMAGYIEDQDVQDAPLGGYRQFGVRY